MGILFLGLNIVTISGVLGLTMLKAHQGVQLSIKPEPLSLIVVFV